MRFRTCCVVTVLMASCAFALPARAQPIVPAISVCTLSNERTKYHSKALVATGVITSIHKGKSSTGRNYWTLQLKDPTGGCFVRLYLRHAPYFLAPGQQLDVFGAYFSVYKFYQYQFSHEIHPSIFYVGNNCQYWLTGIGYVKGTQCP